MLNVPKFENSHRKVKQIINDIRTEENPNGMLLLNDTPFQRKTVHNVEWNQELIESFFDLQGFLPPIYVSQISETGEELIIDGKQRLTALYQFYKGQFSIYITVTGNKREYKYETLPDLQKRHLDNQLIDFKTIQDLSAVQQVEFFDKVNRSSVVSLSERLNSLRILNGIYMTIEEYISENEDEFKLLIEGLNQDLSSEKYRFKVEEFICQLIYVMNEEKFELDQTLPNDTYQKIKSCDKDGANFLDREEVEGQLEVIKNILSQLSDSENVPESQKKKKKRTYIGKISFFFPLCYFINELEDDEEVIEDLVNIQNEYLKTIIVDKNNKKVKQPIYANNRQGASDFYAYLSAKYS